MSKSLIDSDSRMKFPQFKDCEIEFYRKGENDIELSVIVPGNTDASLDKVSVLVNFLSYVFNKEMGYFIVINQSEAKEIPETKEEKSGLKKGYANINCDCRVLNEVTKKFIESIDLEKYWEIKDALSWFEEGKRATMPIIRFVCFYKVLEQFYREGRKGTKEQLKTTNLKVIIEELVKKDPKYCFNKTADEIIDKLVSIRDNCSHMTAEPFGYSPLDRGGLKKVNKWLPRIQKIAEEVLSNKLRKKS